LNAQNPDNAYNMVGSNSFRRFVAGPSILERNPLSEPLSTVGSANYARFPAFADSAVNNI